MAAGCSSSPASPTNTGDSTPAILPSGGDGSPGAAAAGFITGVLGVDRALACDYVLPSQKAACSGAVAAVHITAQHTSLGNTDQVGDKALVVLLATKLCVSALIQHGSSCKSNADPNKGLPTSATGFAAAYAASLAAGKSTLSTIPCIEYHGKWYVNL